MQHVKFQQNQKTTSLQTNPKQRLTKMSDKSCTNCGSYGGNSGCAVCGCNRREKRTNHNGQRFTPEEMACIEHALYHLRANKIADDNHPHTGWYCGKRGQFVKRHKKALIVLEGFLRDKSTNQQQP